MKPVQDLNVKAMKPLVTPRQLKQELPTTPGANATVYAARETVERILLRQDRRFLVVVGPCSIHDPAAALDYAGRLQQLAGQLSDRLYLVMRVYFEKPRTRVGWKGLINDPRLDGSCDVADGLRLARQLLLEINAMGLPTATEMLDPITPQYIADLVAWTAIGARTTESQTHRELASGLSMPVGFKNGTDGDPGSAIDALVACTHPQSFLGIDQDGMTNVVYTHGNRWSHLVLRGGRATGPNYDAQSISAAAAELADAGLATGIVVDCSHANSGKDHARQADVLQAVVQQRAAGDGAVVGAMIESNINAGRQDIPADLAKLAYGVSITDGCADWDTTERLLREAHAQLAS